MGLHPHVVGGISLIVTARFIPYPAFPPYDVKKLHPGLRPTSATYMRSCSSPAMLTMIMMMTSQDEEVSSSTNFVSNHVVLRDA